MKKLTRKLFLSVAALGACAVTLVSTTFAWYTTNTSVDVDAISGMTETDSSSNQLYIAAAQSYDSLTKEALTFGAYGVTAAPVLANPNVILKPVYSNKGQYQTIANRTTNYDYTEVPASELNAGFATYYVVKLGVTSTDYNSGNGLYTKDGDVYSPASGTAFNEAETYYIQSSTYYTYDTEQSKYVAVVGNTVDQATDYYVMTKTDAIIDGITYEAEYALADNSIYGQLGTGWYTKDATTYTPVSSATVWSYYDQYVTEEDGVYTPTTIDPVASGDYYVLSVNNTNWTYEYVEADSYELDKVYYTRTADEVEEGQEQTYTYALVESFKPFADDSNVYIQNPESYTKAAMYVKNTQYYTREQANDTVEYATENSENFMEYVLRFKTTSDHLTAMPVYVSRISLINIGYAGAAQTALAYGDGTGIAGAGSYNADLLKALKMDVYVTPVSNANGDGNQGAMVRYTEYDTYAFSSFSTVTDASGNLSTADAIGYYNEVTGAQLVRDAHAANYEAGQELRTAAIASANGAHSLFSIPANSNYVEVRFVFYLDGWDEYCYDVCRKQGFQLALSFSTSSSENVLFKA